MGLFEKGFSVTEGFDAFAQKLPGNPFAEKPDTRGAHRKNDFVDGFYFIEIEDGKEKPKDAVKLFGTSTPHQPFTYGGTQKIVKDYYPGHSEPTVQVLGPRENNLTVRGRLYAKRYKPKKEPVIKDAGIPFAPAINKLANMLKPANEKEEKDRFYRFAIAMQEQIESIRIRGNLLRISMAEFQRYGFLEEAIFNMKTIGDIEYELTFSIIGFNPPSNCKMIKTEGRIPHALNKLLITAFQDFEANYDVVPEGVTRSFADQLRDAISDVAEVVNFVTDFVDVILDEVDDLKAAINRGLGLIKNARATLSEFNRRVGNLNPYGDTSNPASTGISTGYNNATYNHDLLKSSFDLQSYLAQLQAQFQSIVATIPIARHRVVLGDTLQKIALQFFNDESKWSDIYDHNKLTSTVLEKGTILEIPRE